MRTLKSCDARLSVRVYGVVQGVGFRPFVYSLATKHLLAGLVRNTGRCVEIEIQGSAERLDLFLTELRSDAPPLAVIDRVDVDSMVTLEETAADFSIHLSESNQQAWQAVPADTATCSDCLVEMFDEKDRRYLYPFTNCTNCGPRFTIIKSLPYDRPKTSMADFPMCSACQSEYDNSANRRFHAQPNACSKCGPQLSYVEQAGLQPLTGNRACVSSAVQLLRQGKILALKGLGGFHLACDAGNEQAVNLLRSRKGRGTKPFAVMLKDVDAARALCKISPDEFKLLSSPQRPIVLLERLPVRGIANGVAPGSGTLGVVLPYTPLHHILLREYDGPLVMTSGNLSEEPIAIDNDEALVRLSALADGFLLHNRTIISRYDDSVARAVNSHTTLIRRSRGYAPLPIKLPAAALSPVLACGGHLKNTFCLIKEDNAFLSQHIGDLENVESLDHFNESLNRYIDLFDVQPGAVACDKHPQYLSTAVARDLAERFQVPLVPVQHHHAHIVGCMTEYDLNEPVLGVAFDGLGFGDDETLWGGEFFLAGRTSYERFAHFEPTPMPGGSKAIRNPWRMAVSYLRELEDESKAYLESIEDEFGPTALSAVKQQMQKQLNSPLTSSCGRLFDAVSSILGICSVASYEGQAAIELESIAATCEDESDGYWFDWEELEGRIVIKSRTVLQNILKDLADGLECNRIALRFHYAVARLAADMCLVGRDRYGISKVCLSGGVFQNQILLRRLTTMLADRRLECFYPTRLPCNDGGLSFGQAVVAAAQLSLL